MKTFTSLHVNLSCKKTKGQPNPRYRIYIDGIIVTERSFWPEVPMYSIQERYQFEDDNQYHELKLENIDVSDAVFIEKVESFNTDDPSQIYTDNDWKSGNSSFKFLTPRR